MKLSEKNLRKLREEICLEIYSKKDRDDVARLAVFAVDVLTLVCAITADNEKDAYEGVDIAVKDCKKRLHILYGAYEYAKKGETNVKN